MIDRRLFLLSGMAATSLPACGDAATQSSAPTPSRRQTLRASPTGPVIAPEQFGARGDGRSDDTAALQQCIDRAPRGATIRLRRGAVYRIDTNRNPSWGQFGGIKLNSGLTLDLNRAELKALPSVHPRGAVVQAVRVDGWRIIGPGRISGERAEHRGRGGEWGMGIAAFGGRSWMIGPEVEVADCWGDGIYLGPIQRPGHFCEDFLISGVRVLRCRRNGISVTAGRDGVIENFHIETIRGISPEGAIDLEPDILGFPNRNVVVRNGTTRDCSVGVYVTATNERITVTGMDIEGSNSGIIIGDNVDGLRIEDNPRIVSLIGGEEGAALRTVSVNPPSVRGVSIRRNLFAGGGHMLIDVVGDGYGEFVIADNRLQATNRGTQGIGRIGGGTFTGNEAVIGAAAGKANDYFLSLSNVAHGRNSYRNLSPHRMHAIIWDNCRDLGGDRFLSPTLRALRERR